MALTKQKLIARGVPEEKVDELLALLADEAEKDTEKAVKKALGDYSKEVGADDMKSRIEELEQAIADAKAQNEKLVLEHTNEKKLDAVKKALREGDTPVREDAIEDVLEKIDLGQVKLDKDGQANIADRIKELAKAKPFFFAEKATGKSKPEKQDKKEVDEDGKTVPVKQMVSHQPGTGNETSPERGSLGAMLAAQAQPAYFNA